jgi:hypothetical protein
MNLRISLQSDFDIKLPPRTQAGQVIIEYVLLLVIVVTLSSLIVTQMASRNEDSPGVLIRQWNAIIQQIGADDPSTY